MPDPGHGEGSAIDIAGRAIVVYDPPPPVTYSPEGYQQKNFTQHQIPTQDSPQDRFSTKAPRSGRVVLTDNTGRWFDVDRARRFMAHQYSYRSGQALYYTKSGLWVLWTPANRNLPSTDEHYLVTSKEMTAQDANAWLIAEGHPVPAELASTATAKEI